MGVIGRNEIAEHLRAAGREPAAGAEDVLLRDGNPGERACRAGRKTTVGIPGLGSYTIDAIQSQDFAIVRAMVFLGSVLYIIGLILTDISYTLVDPRVRLD